MVQYRRIGELLMEKGFITCRQLQSALKAQLRTGLRFGEILTMTGKVTEEQITQCLAEQYDYPMVDPESLTPEMEALSLVDKGFALSRLVLPVRVVDGSLECVVSDPVDIAVTDTLTHTLHMRMTFCLAPPTRLYSAIARAYGVVLVPYAEGVEMESRPSPPKDVVREKAKVVQPQKDRTALLEELASLPTPPSRRSLWAQVVAR
jgi:type IV pilus assembly protein PilB